jgi:hypothetical protein
MHFNKIMRFKKHYLRKLKKIYKKIKNKKIRIKKINNEFKIMIIYFKININ